MNDSAKISPKVHAGAAGGVGGLTIGKAISIIVIAKVFDTETEVVKMAIEFLIEAVVATAGIYVGGYIKSA